MSESEQRKLPTKEQIFTILSYLFLVLLGIYIGGEYYGMAGAIVGAVLAIPTSIVVGLFFLIGVAAWCQKIQSFRRWRDNSRNEKTP